MSINNFLGLAVLGVLMCLIVHKITIFVMLVTGGAMKIRNRGRGTCWGHVLNSREFVCWFHCFTLYLFI